MSDLEMTRWALPLFVQILDTVGSLVYLSFSLNPFQYFHLPKTQWLFSAYSASSALSFSTDRSLMNLVSQVHLLCISFLLFIKLPSFVFFFEKWRNKAILSLMHNLQDFVPADFIREIAEPDDKISSLSVFRHQADTSSLQEKSMSWQWDQR